MGRRVIERHSEASPSLLKRVAWLVAIWICSVLALGLVAYGFRFLMRLAGLSL